MKPILTFLTALAFAIAGISLAVKDNNDRVSFRQNTIAASTLPNWMPKMPLDLQLDMEKKYTKTDTVYVPQEILVVSDTVPKYKPKSRSARTRKSTSMRRNLRSPAVEPDSIVKNQVRKVREEQTLDTIGLPKESIILVVDGKEVYKR